MDVFKRIHERLLAYPELNVQAGSLQIVVDAPSADGFEVSLMIVDGEYTVGYAGWHEHFQSADEAIACFFYGLFGDCRLKVVLRGADEYRWSLENRRGSEWNMVSVTGLLFFPFWRRKRTVYRRNALPERGVSDE